MPLPRRAQGRSRHANPYNSWVAHERLQKYYDRKKRLARFRRLERYESKQQSQRSEDSCEKQSFLEQAIRDGPEAFEAEYERRLALSFGDVPPPDATLSTKKAKRKKRKQQHITAIATTGDDETSHKAKRAESVAGISELNASTKRMKKGSAASKAAPPVDKAVGNSREQTTKLEKSKAEEEVTTNKKSRKERQLTKTAVPNRFAKELKKYQEEQEAKEAEWLRRQEEIAERKQKRRSYKRERAVKQGLLAQRTSRGQPNMTSMLQMLTAKLKPEVSNG
mmetsp:Transcript_99424/g.197003  ORF Transcript_99424/g.197003 Transcript_99424/m.197003 type:complete len:279 (-) Transcript_99424:131-967(-)|eukprot:CAMPEP_0172661260 /NCGR_PEP_ID=MMETSP1074-20121228/4580_1 /TAXON_ID=2916 /ORGANISM="Ceratium fusus, Strain PA161109" /LENGTH=278 /DNA_ID=CAMNT_0013476999 /DNA_START=24 /DNA_END=860 /DNA_ORIENTATION=+